MLRILPLRERVQRSRTGQPSQRWVNRAWRERALMVTVIAFGHVAVIASRSMVKSSIVNPAGIWLDSGIGLIVAVCPCRRRWSRNSPDPYAESPSTSTGSISSAIRPGAAWASPTLPAVRSQAVISPVSGSIPMWALNPSR